MAVNNESIYGTRPLSPYRETKIAFTSRGSIVYAVYLADEDEDRPPSKVMLYSHGPAAGGTVRMLGVDRPLRWERVGKGVLIEVPESILGDPPCRYAWVFKIENGSDRKD